MSLKFAKSFYNALKMQNERNMPVLSRTDADAIEHQKAVGAFQQRIQKAVFGITEHSEVRTEDRNRLDNYIRHVSPSLANNGDTQLPLSLRRCLRDHDRTASPTGLVFFHVGNAIVTFYEFVTYGQPMLEHLERRVSLIETMAKQGTKRFRIVGSDREGFCLMHRDEMPTPFLAAGKIEPDPVEDDDNNA